MNDEKINKKLFELLNASEKFHEKQIAETERELAAAHFEALKRVKNEIALMFEKYGDDVTLADMISYNRLKSLEKKIADELKELTGKEIGLTKTAIKKAFTESYYRTAYNLETALEMSLGFSALDKKTIAASVVNKMDLVGWDNRIKEGKAVYLRNIKEEITQGLIQGNGYSKIARSVAKKSAANYNRIIRVVRTEAGRAQSAGGLLAHEHAKVKLEKSGIKMRREWLATLDGRTRDSHRAMDKQKENGEGLFVFPSGATAPAPRLSWVAKEDINCRCTVISVVSGYDKGKRRAGKKIVENMSYEEWKKGVK